jgi:hypothetical protein
VRVGGFVWVPLASLEVGGGAVHSRAVCVCRRADVCSVPMYVGTAVDLCVGWCVCGAPFCPDCVGVLVLSGCALWMSSVYPMMPYNP